MRIRILLAFGAGIAGLLACQATDVNPTTGQNVRRVTVLRLSDVKADRYIADGIDQRPDSAALRLPSHTFDTDEEGQYDSLPPLPFGVTVANLRDGDRLFRGKGGCVNCHGAEAEGLPARGKTLTAGLRFIPVGSLDAIDSTIRVGMPDARTRSPVAMPPRGQWGDLDVAEMHHIAAYVWAISQVKGEPWPGGHAFHASHDWRASARTSIP
jgi:hypothetical protein